MKIMVFENDSDFEFFALDKRIVKKQKGSSVYYDWNYTDEYYEEVCKGTLFFIKDKSSKIVHRNSCTYGIISKPVKNVRRYNGLIVKSNNPSIEIEEMNPNIENEMENI